MIKRCIGCAMAFEAAGDDWVLCDRCFGERYVRRARKRMESRAAQGVRPPARVGSVSPPPPCHRPCPGRPHG